MKFWKNQIADPIRHLDLDRLGRQLEAFNLGYIAEFAHTAEAMEQRDDILRNVILKRKKAVARHPWEILAADGSPEARRHQQALEFFYGNLRCTHVFKRDLTGGFNLLVHQMLDAIAKGWAVHEITWKPTVLKNEDFSRLQNDQTDARSALTDQSSIKPNLQSSIALTAHLRFVPLWFFENTIGELRFLKQPYALEGEPLAPREWLVTAGDALMVACSRAFLFKHVPLQGWLDYCNKYGTPGLRGTTAATRGTPEWEAMEEALESFMAELSVVTNSSEDIELIDLKGRGEAPYALLVERMDRVMAALWRGADLSTISRNRGYGASLQEEESRVLEVDDAEMITDTLNNTIDRWVIEYLFGPGTVPRAYLKILVAPKECTPHDLAIDHFLVESGARLSLSKTLERYGRAAAEPGETALEAAPGPRLWPRPAAALTSPTARIRQPNNAVPSLELSNGQSLTTNRKGNETMTLSNENSAASTLEIEIENQNSKIENSSDAPAFQSAISNLQSSIQLSPFGSFSHPRGMQLVDQTAAANIIKNFNSFFARLGRRFAGVPFFIGHPDVPGCENEYPDKKAYGWIMELMAREDGLYGRAKWSKAGQELLENAHYKFLSPFWEVSDAGFDKGRKLYRPHTLISVGLTNNPNLPVLPLSNEERRVARRQLRFLGNSVTFGELKNRNDCRMKNDQTDARSALIEQSSIKSNLHSPIAHGSSIAPEEFLMNQQNKNNKRTNMNPNDETLNNEEFSGLKNERLDARSALTERSSMNTQTNSSIELANVQSRLATLDQRITELNSRLLSVMLDNAISDGRITPAQRESWFAELDRDFATKSVQLANTARVLKTQDSLENYARRIDPNSKDALQKRLQNAVQDEEKKGKTYDQAWTHVRREYPGLFTALYGADYFEKNPGLV